MCWSWRKMAFKIASSPALPLPYAPQIVTPRRFSFGLCRLPQDRSVNLQLVMDGRLGGVHPLRLFIEVLPELLAKRRILDEPHHIGGQSIAHPAA